jgi:hypothetical protein
MVVSGGKLMAKTNAERVLDYLWSVGPEGATNAQIREATGIQSHQQVYMLTQQLSFHGKILSRREGKEWVFFVSDSTENILQSPGHAAPSQSAPKLTATQFEVLARHVFSQHFGAQLQPGKLPGVPKLFDLVSADGQIAGDAKYFTLVGGQHLPPAKFSIIAEHVWLLEKTGAANKFLVFGNDIEVPKRWLERYGHLCQDVRFYFLSDVGEISLLNG